MDAIKLSSNENPLGCSPRVLERIAEASGELHIYPDATAGELIDRLAERCNVSPGQVIVGNGSDELLTMIAATYLNPTEHTLIGAHTFSQYRFVTQLFDGTAITIPMPELEISPLAYLEHVTDRTKIVFLCSPNNPTGITFSQEDLQRFMEELPQRILVVVDHAYIEYQRDARAANADQLVGRYPNLVVLHTFSKIYGLAALRLGYAVAHPTRIAELMRVKSPFNVNTLAQVAGIAALEDQEFFQRSLETNENGYHQLRRLCEELKLTLVPSEANFVTIDLGHSARKAADYLATHGVTVRPLDSFGLPEHLRITIGTQPQLDTFTGAFRAYMDTVR